MKQKNIIILSVLLSLQLVLVQCSSDKRGNRENVSPECPDASNPACLSADANPADDDDEEGEGATQQNNQTPVVCGDGTCQSTETSEACPADCPASVPQTETAAATADTTPPTIVSITPDDNGFFVPVHATVKVIFSEPIDPSSITEQTFKVMANRSEAVGFVDVRTDGVDLAVNLSLRYGTEYTVVISAGIKDLVGNTSTAPHTSSFRTRPVPIDGGFNHTLALTQTGAVYTWGSDDFGQLGDGPPVPANPANPVQVISPAGAGDFLADIVSIAGFNHSLAVGSDGSVFSWGLNASGQLGHGSIAEPTRSTPVGVVAPWGEEGFLSGIVAVASGQEHSLALANNGGVFAWGSNGVGQLGSGDGVLGFYVQPRHVAIPAGVEIVAIAAGATHSVALARDGSVYTWGSDFSGQLGDGIVGGPFGLFPARVVAPADSEEEFLTGIVAIAAGGNHTMALTKEGNVYAWGSDGFGELGNDAPLVNSSVPVQINDSDGVGSLGNIVSIACGYYHNLALTKRGEVFTWGLDSSGQLGDGVTSDPANRPLPHQVVSRSPPAGLQKIVGIAAGASHSIALGIDGEIWTWGTDEEGQLGDGTVAIPLDDPIPNLVLINP